MNKSFKIESFMIDDLGLKGNDLVLYAFLWDKTKGGRKVYEGDHRDIVGVLNVTIPTAYNVLRNLETNGLIVRDGLGKTGSIKVCGVKET